MPLHVERKVIGTGERPMAKMTFERLRTRVLPCVSETANISILKINSRDMISPCDQEGRQTESFMLIGGTKSNADLIAVTS